MVHHRAATRLAFLVALGLSCTTWPTPGAPPSGKLPTGVRPVHYALSLEILPERDHFEGQGTITVELDTPRDRIWLHGGALDIDAAGVTQADGVRRKARWRAFGELGALLLPEPMGPGRIEIDLHWRAAFGRQLTGLYKVEAGGDAYAFTQFEPISARSVFPSFDEPRFKTPFDVTLIVDAEQAVIANMPVSADEDAGHGLRRVRFASTPPLPTYLVAFAVGPFDVVPGHLGPAGPRSQPLPFRGVTVRGRGDELEYALGHTAPLLEALEDWFGEPHPFAKLDVIAVPDFSAGAMENVGAVTFRDSLLLIDPAHAPEHQRRGFSYVMAHELAHMWFGNLVTMPWWDDIWLNEAFATWMGHKAVARAHPEQHAEMGLLRSVHGAMDADARVSARRIRQPIESDHDISNAFDGITYSKGAGVLSMFERWLGEDVFRAGVRLHLDRYRYASANATDLLRSLSEASGRDVTAPFDSFLTQPGLPLLRTELVCDEAGARLRVEQSRYLPIGSAGDPAQTWQLPVCVRSGDAEGVHEHCALVEQTHAEISLGATCPDWVLPNADGAGYFRFAGSPRDSDRLRRIGWPRLAPTEKLAVADSLLASFEAGALGPEVVFPALEPLPLDETRAVSEAPMGLLRDTLEHLATTPASSEAARGFATALYRPLLDELGWQARDDEDGETRLLRGSTIEFLALVVRDPDVRREAARRGWIRVGLAAGVDELEPELVGTALACAIQEGTRADFDFVEERLASTRDAVERRHLLEALGSTLDPTLAERARALALSKDVRVNEMFSPLWAQIAIPEQREATWSWVQTHHRALNERAGPRLASSMPWLSGGFCETERAEQVQAFFGPFIEDLEGGPRNLASVVEAIRLCAARARVQGPPTRAWLSGRARPAGADAARR